MGTTRAPSTLRLEHTFATELPELGVSWKGRELAGAELLVLNEQLAGELGLDPEMLRSPEGIAALTGAAPPAGARPIAMAYAGHQFGSWSGQLGDGRALLLGEVVDRSGARRDLHLKGSGRTPFARGGDGLAVVGPMLREYVIGEAMHALGVPTTRALAVLTTGESVARETMLPGAVLVRVAASHLRVGTFQWVQARQDTGLLRRLADYAIARHYPDCAADDDPVLAFYDAVVARQAALVARWMEVGFIHGVMNTDNMAISGETIDYGPCAFMDRFDPATVFSSIDHGGRYAYGAQPQIAQWNLARLAEALVPLLAGDGDTDAAVERVTAVLGTFPARFGDAWGRAMRRRIGLGDGPPHDGDEQLLGDLLEILRDDGADYTSSLRALAGAAHGDDGAAEAALGAAANERFAAWSRRWQDRIEAGGRTREEAAEEIERHSPISIPRNHLVEEALDAATAGDLAPVEQLVAALVDPFTERPGRERYAEPGSAGERYVTYCGT